jgi:signal transduction histidine kinase
MPEPDEADLAGLRRLADQLSDGLAVIRDGRIVWVNQRLADLVGRPPEALLGREPGSLVAPGCPALDHEVETKLARTNDQSSAVRALRVCGGSSGSATWIFRDQSRAGDLEHEVLHLGRALREANLQLDAMRERVKHQRTDLDELLTVVSHELRTPVTVVSGYARLLLSERVGTLNEEQRGFLEQSLKSCRRLNGFIANLLANSRNAGSDAPLQVHEAPLEPTLSAVLQSFTPLLDEQGVTSSLTTHPETPTARFDPIQIEQVITNLLENVIKYGRPKGTLAVHCRPVRCKGRDFVEVSVSDDGPGVPEADRERIFERYVRAGEQRVAGGLGLGLAICRRAVTAHGGVMGVTDSDTGGARFWFTLPAATAAAADPSQDPEMGES